MIACNCPIGHGCLKPRPHEECVGLMIEKTATSRKMSDLYVNLVSAYAHSIDIILANSESEVAERALETYFGSMEHYRSLRQALDDLNNTIALAEEGRADLVPELLMRLMKLIGLMPGRARTN